MTSTRLVFWLACAAALAMAARADIPADNKTDTITENDLRVEITTDKKVYHAGEPVMVILKVTNLTDRTLYMDRHYPHCDYSFTVFARKNTAAEEEENTAEGGVEQSPAMGRRAGEVEVPKTALGRVEEGWGSYRGFHLPAHCEYVSMVQANACYDLMPVDEFIQENGHAVYRIEWRYAVLRRFSALFTVRAETTFEVSSDFTSPSQRLGDDLAGVFGKARAVRLLCAEAEDVLRTMREHPEMQDEESAERKRLMIVLDTLGSLCELSSSDRLEGLKLHDRMSLDDFEGLVGKCRGGQQGVRR